MKWFAVIVAQVLFVSMVNNEALPASQEKCKQFRVVFENEVKELPQDVVINNAKVGSVGKSSGLTEGSQVVPICVENKYAGSFEKNSVCYIVKGQMLVYNVWSTGVDLKEGESVRGFTSRTGLFVYEAKELFLLIRDAAVAFAISAVEKVFGEQAAAKLKAIYDVIAR